MLAPGLAKMLATASTCSQIRPTRSTPVDFVSLADDASTSDAIKCASSAPPLPCFDLLAPDVAKLLEPASTCSQMSPYSLRALGLRLPRR
jgi:hypothetical protein